MALATQNEGLSLKGLPAKRLIDGLGREINYVRISVTDRCDLRCTYCMAEKMRFLPKSDVLSLEELDEICACFIDLGVRRIRLTGGEPLVRNGIMMLIKALGARVKSGVLSELSLTTNGTQLSKYAASLADAGIARINVSLDTLNRTTFERITRRDALNVVLAGIKAASDVGIKIKINTVALQRDNRDELPYLIDWAHSQGHDLTLIETMPLGDVAGDRTDQYVSLKSVRADLDSYWTLEDIPDQTGGPARYVRIAQTGGRLGFITPLSHNFCASCNRVRVTCSGTLYTCLGQEEAVDLKNPLRSALNGDALKSAIETAIMRKPKSHDFHEAYLSSPHVARYMSVTGG